MPTTFRPGDRVRVAADHPWAPNATATVADGWPTWPRQRREEDGTMTTLLFVHFDQPQVEGDAACESAEIPTALLAPA